MPAPEMTKHRAVSAETIIENRIAAICEDAGSYDAYRVACGIVKDLKAAGYDLQKVAPNGYAEAFYDIGALLGLSAMPVSPAQAYREVMRPKVVNLLSLASERQAQLDHEAAMRLTANPNEYGGGA